MIVQEENSGSQPSVRALERGLDVLDAFCADETSQTLTAISSKIKLTLPTTLRIVSTLERRGYLERDGESKKYSLGPHILHLLSSSTKVRSLRQVSAPYLISLQNIFNESASLYVLAGNYRICLDRIESSHPLRHGIVIGDKIPLCLGAGGKAIAAWLPEAKQRELMTAAPLNPDIFSQIRQNGYSVTNSERAEGITAIAAPIFNRQRNVIASLSLSGPSLRMTSEKLQLMILGVTTNARKISCELETIL